MYSTKRNETQIKIISTKAFSGPNKIFRDRSVKKFQQVSKRRSLWIRTHTKLHGQSPTGKKGSLKLRHNLLPPFLQPIPPSTTPHLGRLSINLCHFNLKTCQLSLTQQLQVTACEGPCKQTSSSEYVQEALIEKLVCVSVPIVTTNTREHLGVSVVKHCFRLIIKQRFAVKGWSKLSRSGFWADRSSRKHGELIFQR